MSKPINHKCPECGAAVPEAGSCKDHFHELLALEWQLPDGPNPVAHFYAVSSYNLQHPISSGLKADALEGLSATVKEVLNGKITLEDARRRARQATQETGRVTRHTDEAAIDWGITNWPITVKDVCAGGMMDYAVRVERWARSIQESLAAKR